MKNKNQLGAAKTMLGNSHGDVMTAAVNSSIGSGVVVATAMQHCHGSAKWSG